MHTPSLELNTSNLEAELHGGGDFIDSKWRIREEMSSSSYGPLFTASNEEDRSEAVVKIANSGGTDAFRAEVQTYEVLKRCEVQGVPIKYYHGEHRGYKVCVFQKLGESIEQKFKQCGGVFSVGTACLLAIEITDRLEDIHASGFLYCNLLPKNIFTYRQVSKGRDAIYITDFGLAKPVEDGCPYSYKDDMNTLVDLFVSICPKGVGEHGADVLVRHEELKQNIASLGKRERPDYDAVRCIFRSTMEKANINETDGFDWEHTRFSLSNVFARAAKPSMVLAMNGIVFLLIGLLFAIFNVVLYLVHTHSFLFTSANFHYIRV